MAPGLLDALFLAPPGADRPGLCRRMAPHFARGRAAGLTVERLALPGDRLRRLAFLLTLPRARTAVIEQGPLAAWELALLRRRCGRLVLDLDAAPPDSASGAQRALASACALADLALAADEALAERVRAHQPNVVVLPTLLDATVYAPAPPDAVGVGPLRVGWLGAARDFGLLAGVLRELAPHAARLELRVVAERPYAGELAELVRSERWSAALEPAQLQGFDCGLLPLSGGGPKAWECLLRRCMACGVAPIVTDTAAARAALTPGVDGFLAERPGDWAAHVLRLADDPGLRESMAAAARSTAVERFSLERHGGLFWEALGIALPGGTDGDSR